MTAADIVVLRKDLSAIVSGENKCRLEMGERIDNVTASLVDLTNRIAEMYQGLRGDVAALVLKVEEINGRKPTTRRR